MEPRLEQLVARRDRHVRFTDILSRASIVIALIAASVSQPVVATVLFSLSALAACVAFGFLLQSHHEGAVIHGIKPMIPKSKVKRVAGC